MRRTISTLLVLVAAISPFGLQPTAHAAIVTTGDVQPANPATWTSTTTAYVGKTSNGSLTIDLDSDAVASSTYIGFNSGVTGLMTIDGPGATFMCSGPFFQVGSSGSGSLIIGNGGAVDTTSSNYAALLGYSAGSMGIVTVDGEGSTWTSARDLHVGESGSGTLNLSAGGTVTAGKTYLAYRSGSTGSLAFGPGGGTLTARSLAASPTQITGSGIINTRGLVSDVDLLFDSPSGLRQALVFQAQPTQTVTVNLDLASDPDANGDLGAGWKGCGSLTIRGGVAVNSELGFLGYHSGSTGQASIAGAGSTWVNAKGLYVGYSGNGVLNVTAGGAIRTPSLSDASYIGYQSGSAGTVTLDGDSSTWIASSDLYVGYHGTGTLSVLAGGAVNGRQNRSGYIGYYGGGPGTVVVDGVGSQWTGHTDLYVGYYGRGTLEICRGGVVASVKGTVGYYTASNGTVAVDGAGSTWTTTGRLVVGDWGRGTLSITSGGAVNAGYLKIGWTSAVAVDGADSRISVGALGVAGGSLTITSGATVSSSGSTLVGENAPGVITVDGASSVLAMNGILHVGYYANGSLNISGGANVTAGGTTYVGTGGYSGAISFGAGGGTLTTASLVASPVQLTGTGTILTHGLVSDVDLVFDAHSGLRPTLTLQDPVGQSITVMLDMQSTPATNGELGAGCKGKGSLTIRDGVSVNSSKGLIGYWSGSNGMVTVTGVGSQWIVNGDLGIGLGGTGNLLIAEKGAVNSLTCQLGTSGGPGSLSVDGAGSEWINRGDLYVGVNRMGTLRITAGGTASSYKSKIGSSGAGVLIVDGPNSRFDSVTRLDVNYNGTIAISGGGVVTSSVVVTVPAALLAIDVGNNSCLIVNNGAGVITNGGTIRLLAGARAEAGVSYMPISAGTFSGTGTYQAVGGVWSPTSHQFISSSIQSGAAGQILTADLSSQQRVRVDDPTTGWRLGASFLAKTDGTATSALASGHDMPMSSDEMTASAKTGTTLLSFVATPVSGATRTSLEQLLDPGDMLIGGWQFTVDTGYTAGEPAYLSFDAGPGLSRSDFSVWRFSGTAWASFDAIDLTYDGRYASFTVTELDGKGYAVSAVPEPTTVAMLLAAVLAGAAWRFRAAVRLIPAISRIRPKRSVAVCSTDRPSNRLTGVGLWQRRFGNSTLSLRILQALLIIVVLCCSAVPAKACVLWSAAVGDWSEPGNWTGGEPTPSIDAAIYNDGTANITQLGEVCVKLYLGAAGVGKSGTVHMSGGSLSASHEYVGETGTGVFTQTGGTNTVAGNLYLGYAVGGNGTYNLNGGTLVLQSLIIGSGTAAFNFGGGTLKAGSSFTSAVPMHLTGTGGNANLDTAGYAVTLSGPLSGSGGLNKLGAGSLTLTGDNSFTGTVHVNAGILAIPSATAFPGWNTPGNYSVAAGAGLTVGDSFATEDITAMLTTGNFAPGSAIGFDVTMDRTFAGNTLPSNVGLAKSGNGTLTLSSALATTTGAVIITAGTLDLHGFTARTSGNISFHGGTVQGGVLQKSGGVFDAQAGTVSTVLGDGASPAGLVKSGSGLLTLSAANTFTGGTTVSDGTLRLAGGNDRLAATGAIAINGGTLDLSGYSQQTSGTVSIQGGAVQNGWLKKSGGNFDVQAGTISARLMDGSMPAGLVKSGSGVATLASPNGYTGSTTISAGVLSISFANSLPWWNVAGKWSVAPGAALAVGSMSDADVSTLIGTGNFAPGSAIGFDVATTRSCDGGSLPAHLGLTKVGPGTLSLSGAGTYGGGTTVRAGTLKLVGGHDRLPTQGAITVMGGVFDLGGYTQHTSGAVSFQGGITQNGTISKSGSDYDAQSGTVSAVLTGNVGLTKSGPGTLTLSGWNTYTGPTNIVNGTLQLASGPAVPSASIVNISPGATLDLNGLYFYAPTINGSGTIALGTGTITFSSITDRTLGACITGQGRLIKSGPGMLNLTNANTYTGITTLSAGVLRLSHAEALPGGTEVGAGGSPLCFDSGVLELAAGDFTRSFGTGPGQVYFIKGENGGFSAAGADRIVNIGGASEVLWWGRTHFLDVNYSLILGAPTADATVDLQNPLNTGTNPNKGASFRVEDGAASIDAKLSGVLSGQGRLSKSGAGTLLLAAVNTYTGKTTVFGGTLRVGVAGALPAASTSLEVRRDATLDLNGFSHTAVDMSGDGTIALGGATLTVDSAAYATISNRVTGAGGFTKTGAGILCVTSTNTYTGPTNVSGGVLRISQANSLPGGTGATGGTNNLILDGGVLELDGSGFSFLRGLGSGPGEVQFASSGGFSVSPGGTRIVNLGGNSAPVTWGQGGFVPDGCSLTLSLPSSRGTLTFQNPIDLGGQNRTVEVDKGWATSPIVNAVLSGELSGSGGLLKAGSGILALEGECSHAGGTTIAAGVLQVGNGGPTGSLGGTVDNQATLVFNRSTLYTFSGSISGTGTVKVHGAAPLVLAAANSYTGATAVVDSILRLAHPEALPGGTGATGGLSNLMVGGSSAVGKNGEGIIELADGDFFRGLGTGPDQVQFGASGGFSAVGAPRVVNLGGASATVVSGSGYFTSGKLILSSGQATDTLDFQNPIKLRGTQTVQVNDGAANIDAKLSGTLSNGGLTKIGSGALELSAANTYSGVTTVSEGILRLNHELALPGGAGSVGGTSNLTLAGGVVDLAAGDFFRSVGTGPDQVQFLSSKGGGFSASGGTRVVNFGGESATFIASSSYPLIFGSPLADSTVEFQNPLRLSSVSYGITTIRVDDGTADVDARLTGTISNAGGLFKSGTGTLEITADNTYTGKTEINTGTLIVANTTGSATGTGAVTVKKGASLSGSGAIGGPVTIAGSLSPGNSPGILTVNNQVVFQATALLNVELYGLTAGNEYDQLITTGPVSLAGSLVANFGNFPPSGHDMLFVINNTGPGATTGTFQYSDNAMLGTFNGYNWYITYDANCATVPSLDGGNDVAIYSLPIPEPSALMLLAVGIISLAGSAWRCRRRAAAML